MKENTEEAVKTLIEMGSVLKRYNGNDNYGKPKTDYLNKLVLMDDQQIEKECKDKIWLSAYANNNPKSDYHWQCDACYDECKRREKSGIYTKAHADLSKS